MFVRSLFKCQDLDSNEYNVSWTDEQLMNDRILTHINRCVDNVSKLLKNTCSNECKQSMAHIDRSSMNNNNENNSTMKRIYRQSVEVSRKQRYLWQPIDMFVVVHHYLLVIVDDNKRCHIRSVTSCRRSCPIRH
jgi:hypothetical protein